MINIIVENGVHLKKDEDGVILCCSEDGNALAGQQAVQTNNAVDDIMTVTATFVVAGWIDDDS